MPRYKSYDWSLTWSPEDHVEKIPDLITELLDSPIVQKAFGVLEYDGKYGSKRHLHVGFRLIRAYDSDYKWWQNDEWTAAGLKAPALCIKATKVFWGLIGGYAAKYDGKGTTVACRKNVSDEDLRYGKRLYDDGLKRARIREYVNNAPVIHPQRLPVAVGAAALEYGAKSVDEAKRHLAAAGFAFGDFSQVDVYRHDYAEWVGRAADGGLGAMPEVRGEKPAEGGGDRIAP